MAKLSQGTLKKTKIENAKVSWSKQLKTVALVEVLGADNMRFVGGCVRDSLQGVDVKDIDIATTLSPQQVMKKLQAAGMKAIPTGIDHGTITAVNAKQHYEITTLRRDVKTHGRHADVEFTDDWQEDANRRDFTFNALYLDVDGNVFDYFNGQEDLEQGRVRFIGDATKRIEEDALRILRYFRFMATVGAESDSLDHGDLDAVKAEASRLTFLSAERVRDELKKLLLAKDSPSVLKLMMEKGIWQYILPNFEIETYEKLVAIEASLGKPDVYRRLSRVFPKKMSDVREASKNIRLSNVEAAHMLSLIHPDPRINVDMEGVVLRELIYRLGHVGFENHAILNAEVEGVENLAKLLVAADNHIPKTFPIKGNDLIEMGLKSGPELGDLMCNLEERWIESDFLISKSDLLEIVKTPRLH